TPLMHILAQPRIGTHSTPAGLCDIRVSGIEAPLLASTQYDLSCILVPSTSARDQPAGHSHLKQVDTLPRTVAVLEGNTIGRDVDMVDLRIRRLDDWVAAELRARARRNGRSLEAELRDLLRQEALRPKQELADRLRRLRAELREKYGTFSDSAALI